MLRRRLSPSRPLRPRKSRARSRRPLSRPRHRLLRRQLLSKPEVARLPTVEGWTLADVGYGGALIRNRRGTWEVYAGDHIPGLGRIDAIRKQDGHWVVVTEKGLIVARQ